MGKHFKKILIISIVLSVLVIVGLQLPFIYGPIQNLINPVTEEDISQAVENIYQNNEVDEESYVIYGADSEEQYGTFSRRYSEDNVFMKISTKIPVNSSSEQDSNVEYQVFIKDLDDEEGIPYNIGALEKNGENYTLNALDLKDAFGDIQVYVTKGFDDGVEVDSAILKTEVIKSIEL